MADTISPEEFARQVLAKAMKLCDFGQPSEKLGIVRIADAIIAPVKANLKIDNYIACINGRPVNDIEEDTRLDHWELNASDILSAMICKVVYENKYGVSAKLGRNMADVLLDELVDSNSLSFANDTISVDLNYFISYIKQLNNWTIDGNTKSILVDGIATNVDRADVYSFYDSSSVDVDAHPGVRNWLKDSLKKLEDGSVNEFKGFFEELVTGILLTATRIERPKNTTKVIEEPVVPVANSSSTVSSNSVANVSSEAIASNQVSAITQDNVVDTSVSTDNVASSLEKFIGYRNHYVVVQRSLSEGTTIKVTHDFYEACALQSAFLTGGDLHLIGAIIRNRQDDLKVIVQNLIDKGVDRLANDEEEVYIFLIRGRLSFR